MKKTISWICSLSFLLLCVAVISFLHSFTFTNKAIVYLDWQSAVQIRADGTEMPFSTEDSTNMPQAGASYRFTAALPVGLGNGFLLFETGGEELTLFLNGKKIYHSSAASPESVLSIAQANVPLPENAAGELTMNCTLLGGPNALFPPLLRFVPDGYIDASNYAYANLTGIPAGASAITMLLIAGLFLLGLARQKTDWSLIPLFCAAAGLTFYRLIQALGFYFLPESMCSVLSWPGFSWMMPLGLLVFLAMNQRRSFWRLFGWAVVWSSGALVVFYLISLWRDGYLSFYLNCEIAALFQVGAYDGLLYWVTLWMTFVSALIAAYEVADSFARQQAQTQTLELKNQLIMDSYQAIETKMRNSAAQRHEFKHMVTALDVLYRQQDYEQLGVILTELREQESRLAKLEFTENFTINAILQNAASRAAQNDISFDAQVYAPKELAIPEKDLCVLLMNMLDNALEACTKINPQEKHFIRIHIGVKNGFLAVKCENTYAGELKKDEQGRLISLKTDKASHGFGIAQMSAVAEKYCSILDISISEENHIFTVQTALKLSK